MEFSARMRLPRRKGGRRSALSLTDKARLAREGLTRTAEQWSAELAVPVAIIRRHCRLHEIRLRDPEVPTGTGWDVALSARYLRMATR